MPIPPRYLQLLTEICNLPTAPFCEEHVIRWLTSWADRLALRHWRDDVGNLSIEYLHGPPTESPLALNAHPSRPPRLLRHQISEKNPTAPTTSSTQNSAAASIPPSFPENSPASFSQTQTPPPTMAPRAGLWIDANSRCQPANTPAPSTSGSNAEPKSPTEPSVCGTSPTPKSTTTATAAPACDDLAGCAHRLRLRRTRTPAPRPRHRLLRSRPKKSKPANAHRRLP